MNHESNKTIQIGLLCLCLLFAGSLWFDLVRDYSLTADENLTVAFAADVNLNNIDQANVIPPITDYTEIIERPLFMQDRRPYVPDETVAAIKPPQQKTRGRKRAKDELLLSAVIITENKRIALIQTGKGKKIQKVMLGEIIDDWTVADVQPGEVSLQKGSETKKLELLVIKSPFQTTQKSPSPSAIKSVKQIAQEQTKQATTKTTEQLPPDVDPGNDSKK